ERDRKDPPAELLSQSVGAAQRSRVERVRSLQRSHRLLAVLGRPEAGTQQVDREDQPALVHIHVLLLFDLLPSNLLVQQEPVSQRRAVGEPFGRYALDPELVGVAEPVEELRHHVGGALRLPWSRWDQVTKP